MITKEIKNCSLKQIAESGQAFRWKQLDEAGNKYSIVAYSNYVEVEQKGDKFTFSCNEQMYNTVWSWYLDTATDYSKFINEADADDVLLQTALRCGYGIRILQQETWEAFITFIISQNNRIGRIRNTVEKMCKKLGECYAVCSIDRPEDGVINLKVRKDKIYYAFPKPEALTNVDDLQGLGLGYRDKYIAAAATAVVNGVVNLNNLRFMPHDEAIAVLKGFRGIGSKVAECISLFGLHHLQAYPVDTWVNKIEKYYGKGYIENRYNGYQGVMQQYLFSYVHLHGVPEREAIREDAKKIPQQTNGTGG